MRQEESEKQNLFTQHLLYSIKYFKITTLYKPYFFEYSLQLQKKNPIIYKSCKFIQTSYTIPV